MRENWTSADALQSLDATGASNVVLANPIEDANQNYSWNDNPDVDGGNQYENTHKLNKNFHSVKGSWRHLVIDNANVSRESVEQNANRIVVEEGNGGSDKTFKQSVVQCDGTLHANREKGCRSYEREYKQCTH